MDQLKEDQGNYGSSDERAKNEVYDTERPRTPLQEEALGDLKI
jgi:hypothetical protein